MLVISGRLRSTISTQSLRNQSRYRLQYQLSYDGGHCFSEKEKRAVAARMQGDYYNDDDHSYGGYRGRTRATDGQSEENVNLNEIVVSVGEWMNGE